MQATFVIDLSNHMFCLQCDISMLYLGHIMVVVVDTFYNDTCMVIMVILIYPLDVTLSVLFSFHGSNLSIQPLLIVHAGELEINCMLQK